MFTGVRTSYTATQTEEVRSKRRRLGRPAVEDQQWRDGERHIRFFRSRTAAPPISPSHFPRVLYVRVCAHKRALPRLSLPACSLSPLHSPHFALPPAVFRARIHAGLTFASEEYKQSVAPRARLLSRAPLSSPRALAFAFPFHAQPCRETRPSTLTASSRACSKVPPRGRKHVHVHAAADDVAATVFFT